MGQEFPSDTPTEVYTPTNFTEIDQIWSLSREALLTDSLSLELGIAASRIVPNDEAVGFVGVQKGDEAKGTWVYRFSHQRPFGVGLRGGAGAGSGHVFKEDGAVGETTHRLLPTTVDDGWTKVVGRAVLGVPEILITEIERLGENGHDNSPNRVMIDGQTFLAWDAYKARDAAEEARRGAKKVGTTQSGVGPAASDYTARTGMNFGMLLLPRHELQERVQEEVDRNNNLLKALGIGDDKLYDADVVYQQMQWWADRLGPYIRNTYSVVVDA